MNKNEILDLLTCPRGCEGTLSQENLEICADEYQGNLKCQNCEYLLPFIDGVIDPTEDTIQGINDIDSYNKNIFFETWKVAPELYNEVPWDTEYEVYARCREQIANKIILDAGCGSGRVTEFILQFNPKALSLLDIGDSIDIANERLSKKTINVPVLYIKTNLNNIPLRGQSIDTVICNGVIHHVADQERVLKEILRVSADKVLLGLVSEKLLLGRIWMSGNRIRKIIKILYWKQASILIAKVLSWIALVILFTFKASPNPSLRRISRNAFSDKFRYAKMHYLMLDFLTAPYYLKYPDNFYLDIAKERGFNLIEELYSNQEIFFVLNRASNRNLVR